MKKIAFATGSRADYGIMRRYLRKLDEDESVSLEILVTGALLDNDYGHQVDLIYRDGFKVGAEIEVHLDTSDNIGIIHTMSETLDDFGHFFGMNKYDLLIILGDRYEMLSVATAAAMQRIPILHIHGGEATYGNYDEFIRHCITKMSLYHFTATQEYRRRVIQLGENPDRVFCLGALGAENCMHIEEANVPEQIKKLPERKYFTVLFHPETLTKTSPLEQVNMLLAAIDGCKDYKFVFLGSNADTHSGQIRKAVRDYVDANDNAVYYENLHTDAYHYLLRNSICLIGNSSSGIIEAPSLGVCTINIGDRQKGRVRGNSVIDVRCDVTEISAALDKVLLTYKEIVPVNPYYIPDSANMYYKTTMELLGRIESDTNNPKEFYNM